MLPQLLSITDFRNIAQARLELAPRLTYLVGDNAQGKTNALEALAYALSLRPLRQARPGDLIRRGAQRSRIDVELSGRSLPWQVRVDIGRSGRQVLVNDKPLRDPAQILGAVALVTFAPDDLQLVKGGPELRRRSLDRFVFQVQPAHLKHVRDLGRALRSRNLLLKRGEREDASLQAFSETLAVAGARVMLGRRMGVALLREVVQRRHALLAPGGGSLDLNYRPSVAVSDDADEASVAEALRQALERSRGADLARRQTCKGPHADELLLSLDGEPARGFASQGQSRSIVLALRLAEVDEIARARGQGPVLLADDLLAELDEKRASALLHTVEEAGARVVATGTRLPAGIDHGQAGTHVCHVQQGRLQIRPS